ncbi:unnamed protein product [Aphanomyces euteiches]|uniref:Uncharacterized protein n=1 Tax=Aphanomyces euteiches TaxID=100861 RepID=A0A6G0W4U0_9STRA|nr:hypothetical protein Ae201684_018695 [Aphanomyces euteiches]KAH9088574.1 hypothetical protein Ae201684P_017183 [Aphanomyces euteiches]
MNRALWEAIRDVDEVQVIAANWAEFFRFTMVNESSMTPFGEDLLEALRAHCSAMNDLDAAAYNGYVEIVNSRVSELNCGLNHARTLLNVAAGINIVQAGPSVLAAFNFWSPVGLVASGIGIGATVPATVCKSLGEKALSSTADMIRDSPRVIQERGSENAIAKTASSMTKLLEIMKQNLGEEKLNHAYMMLMGALSRLLGDNDTALFDVDKLYQAIAQLVQITNAPEFPQLLRLVRDASLSALDCADLVRQFGSAMKTSILRVAIDYTAKGMSSLAMVVGCMLRPYFEGIEKGIGVMIDVMATFRICNAPLTTKQAVLGFIRFQMLEVNLVLSAVTIVCSLVTAGLAIAELMHMDQRMQPLHDAINSIQVSYRDFADGIIQVPRLFREARLAGSFDQVQ